MLGVLLLGSLPACWGPVPIRGPDLPPDQLATFEAAEEDLRLGRVPERLLADRRVNLERAQASFTRVRQSQPEFFTARVRLQDAELALNPAQAKRRYLEPLELRGEEDLSAEELTLAARAELPEDIDQARTLLQKAVKVAPRFAWAHYGLAFLAYLEQDSSLGLGHVEDALDLDPHLRDAVRLRAELLDQDGKKEAALDEYERLLESGCGPAVRQRYARVLLRSDSASKAKKAERELRRVLASLEEGAYSRELRSDTWQDLGVSLALQEDGPGALQAFRQALRVDPDNLAVYYGIGWVLETVLERHEEALAAYEQYRERAQEWEGAFPTGSLLDRWFYVERNIKKLRERLGKRAAPPEASPVRNS